MSRGAIRITARALLVGVLSVLCVDAMAQGSQWWAGFIDSRGKAFLELPDSPRLCTLARDALRRARAEAGRAVALPLKVESLLPRDARLVFGVINAEGVASERVMTRIVTLARDTQEKGACAHLAEAGADAPGQGIEEAHLAFGVHPPRALTFRAPPDTWKSYGTVAAQAGDARFAAAAGTPAAWRARIAPLLPATSEIFGQRFDAVLEAGRPPRPLALIGAYSTIAGATTYNTVNLIAGETGEGMPLYQNGPSGGIERNRAASFVAQVAGMIDLDGDGVDELVLRARYYSGGNLKVLRFSGGKFVELHQTAYEGE